MSWQDPRYGGDEIDWPVLQQAQADVAQRFAVLFGDRPYMDAGGALIFDREGNGMPTLETSPRESPAWRRIIAKARRDIAERSAEIRVRELAERITIDEIQNDIKEIREWANSLKRTA